MPSNKTTDYFLLPMLYYSKQQNADNAIVTEVPLKTKHLPTLYYSKRPNAQNAVLPGIAPKTKQ
jgi:hypothetical protein